MSFGLNSGCRRPRSLVMLLTFVVATSCGPAEVGGTGIYDTEAWMPDHMFTPDEEPCAVPSCDTGDPANCCVGIRPSNALTADDAGCPSNSYPNNWTCDPQTDACVHGGCGSDADCGYWLLKCLDPADVSGTTKFCVQSCISEPYDSCEWETSSMKCTGTVTGGGKYCKQEAEGAD